MGYASDIELFEQFPVNYQSYMKRQNRWLRGDWQIARWVLPTVPGPDGPHNLIRCPSSIDGKSWTTCAAALFLRPLWLCWFELVAVSDIDWTHFIVGLMLLGSSLGFLPSRIAQSLWGTRGGWKEQGREFLRALVSTSLLPYDAFSSLDAIVRVWYRKHISHLYLLEWESAQVSHWKVLQPA